MRFNFNRNILHLILSNPTQNVEVRCKHARYCFKLNPQLLCEKDFNRISAKRWEIVGRSKVMASILKYNFLDVLQLPDLNEISIFYGSTLLKKIIGAVAYLENNSTSSINNEDYLKQVKIPKQIVKHLLNTSLCSTIVHNL